MVRFKSVCKNGIVSFRAEIDDVHRFNVKEAMDFLGGWYLYTLDGIGIERFATLCSLENYIEEMDK